MLKDFPVFFIVFLGLLSVKRAVIHNEIETALEVLCSSKLNFQILEINFQNERTVSYSYRIVEIDHSNPKLIQCWRLTYRPAPYGFSTHAVSPGAQPHTVLRLL